MADLNLQNANEKPSGSWFKNLRSALMQRFVNWVYGRSMTITPFSNSAIAGSVVFWYFESGMRYFVMVRNSKNAKNAGARFVSCLGLGEHSDITSATRFTVKSLLGSVFYKSIDAGLLGVDRVAAVPTFKCEDPTTFSTVPVNSVVWCVQITPEQAGLCQPEMKNVDIVAIPEFAMLGKEVATSHQMIYQTVLRHIHGSAPAAGGFGIEGIEDAFKGASQAAGGKVIH